MPLGCFYIVNILSWRDVYNVLMQVLEMACIKELRVTGQFIYKVFPNTYT